jgi:hypothetical protein
MNTYESLQLPDKYDCIEKKKKKTNTVKRDNAVLLSRKYRLRFPFLMAKSKNIMILDGVTQYKQVKSIKVSNVLSASVFRAKR